MAYSVTAFRPLDATSNIAVTGTAQTVSLLTRPKLTNVIRLCNIGTQTVFVLFSESVNIVAATVSNAVPIPAGQTEVFSITDKVNSFSVIASATGSTLYSTVGEGL